MSNNAKRLSRGLSQRLGSVLAFTLLFLSLFTPGASAEISFGTPGSGAGQVGGEAIVKATGVVVDPANGNVYVADWGNQRIDVFKGNGDFLFAFGWGVADGTSQALQTCTTNCFKGIAGPGLGQINGPQAIAIDSDPSSSSYRDIYVAERDNYRIQKFSPSGSPIFMLGGRVNKTTGKNVCTQASGNTCGIGEPGSGSGEFNGSLRVATSPKGVIYVADSVPFLGHESARVQRFSAAGEFLAQPIFLEEASQPGALAANSAGDFYLSVEGQGVIRRYDSTGTLVETFPGSTSQALAVDSSDNFFAGEDRAGVQVITEYDSNGTPLRRFGGGSFAESGYPTGLAPYHTATGEVYVTTLFSPEIRYMSFPPPGPLVCCVSADPIGNTVTTLNATINPEGKETTYSFEYVDLKSFETEGGFASPITKSTPAGTLPADVEQHPVSAQASVEPSTTYRYRLVANNSEGSSTVDGGQFESLSPFDIGATWSTEVGTDAANLQAAVNPLGIPAIAHFQYVDDATYRADVEAGGPGQGFDHAIETPESTLGSGETAVRANVFLYPLSPGATYHYRVVVADSFVTESGEEHTFTTFPLPSVPATACSNQAFRTGASVNLPDCRAFEMVSPVEKNGNDIRVNLNASNYPAGLDAASSEGDRFSYSSSAAFGGAPSSPWTSQYVAIRDPGTGWATHAISPAREPKSIFAQINVYLDLQYKAFSPDLSEGWFLHDTGPVLDSCGAEGYLNLYRRDDESGEYEALTTAAPSNGIAPSAYWPELVGTSADGTHTVFRADGKLTKDAANSTGYQLYEHIAGKNGCGTLRLVSVLPNGKASVPPNNGGDTAEGRNERVTHLISEDGSRIFWADEDALYVRTNGKTTVQVSAGPAFFVTAAPDGSKVIYTTGSKGKTSDLYEYNVDKAESTLIAAEAYGVAGTSDDASRVYFASAKALAPGAEAGKPNLYLHEPGGQVSFIATLAPEDSSSALRGPFNVVVPDTMSRGTRVTPDGEQLAFVSKGSLTGYDNADADDGRPNLEVYLYDAANKELRCVSCNPSGARPVGRLVSTGSAEGRVASELPSAENQFFAPRALTDDGDRLFFNSYEALVPRDTNGKEDVYEWERSADAQGCEEAGAELYVESAGGCLSLISSGQSSKDSEFDDASPDGSNVFIKTASSLLPQDDGLIDVYDAREGGGYPPPPTTPPACEGEACQGLPSPPNDPTPASSAFEGAGNVKEEPQGRKPGCAKGKTRRKGRCVAKKPHATKTNPHKKRAANHKRRAGR